MNRLSSIIAALIISCSPPGNNNGDDFSLSDNNPSYLKLENNNIINLYDAFGKNNPNLKKDFGFSCILKFNGKTILFDAGTNADIFKKNVTALNIDLRQVDFAIASHAHFDHINGFDHLLEVNPDVKIYFPFDLFWGANMPYNLAGKDTSITNTLDKSMQYFDGDYKDYQFNQSGRFWKANIEFIKNNAEISPGVSLITTSSPYMGYYSKYPSLGISNEDIDQNGNNNTRFIQLPEISLSLSTENGEVIIVGCSHSTVEQIIIDTKKYTKNEIALVYGGYHLLPYDQETLQSLSTRLKNELKVKKVAPAHCTGHLAFKILKDQFQENYHFAGLGEIVHF